MTVFEFWLEFEKIFDVVNFMFFQLIVENPDAILQESQVRSFIGIQIETEPQILVTVELENHFEEGTWLE